MIKNSLKVTLAGIAAVFLSCAAGFAQQSEPENAALIEKLKPAYPLQTCVVSGEKLEKSDMGDPVDYLYEEPGKTPVLVRFCCKGCLKSFKKDPAKYLKTLSDTPKRAASGH